MCYRATDEFSENMRQELRDNREKGGRDNWMRSTPMELLNEVHDHGAKLHIATRELIRRRAGLEPRALPWGERHPESLILEFAADTANMAMMLCDRLGLLDPPWSPKPLATPQTGEGEGE